MNIKVFTTFSGYDSQCLALERLKRDFPIFDYELVGWSEIDKFAIKAHDALFPQARNYGDITKIEWAQVPDFDLFTCSSPCQDFSQAGLQRGGEKGSGTRSSLLWECERAIRAKKPKFIVFENVSALVSAKFIDMFNLYQRTLEELGYRNYAKVLNAKDYGVPQNRERIFLVSIREDVALRYYFPLPFKLEKRLKDVLEDNVDEKYYVSDARIAGLIESTRKEEEAGRGFAFCVKSVDDIANTLQSKPTSRKTDNFIIVERGVSVNPFSHKLEYDGENSIKEDVSPCLRATDYKCPHVVHERMIFKGRWIKEGDGLYTETTAEEVRGGLDGVSRALKAEMHDAGVCVRTKDGEVVRLRIRKLTERECFRLMGCDDADIDKIQSAGISKTQQYKMAGNSIVVDVLYHIFRKMFVETNADAGTQLELF